LTPAPETGKLAAQFRAGYHMNSAEDPLAAARAALQPGEVLVWAGRPDPAVLAQARLPQRVRGLLGLAVIAAFLWLSFIPNWPDGYRGVLLAIFLAAAALYACWLVAAPRVARRAAGHTLYAVTDRRVLIREDWPFARERSYGPADLDDPLVKPVAPPLPEGLASVAFVHRKLPWWERRAGSGYRIEAFHGIAGAQRVAEHLNSLRLGEMPEEEA